MNPCPNCGAPRGIYRYCRKCRCDLEEYDRRLEMDDWYASLPEDEKDEYGPYEPQAREFDFARDERENPENADFRVSGAAGVLGAGRGRFRVWNAAAFLIGTSIVPVAVALKSWGQWQSAGAILVTLLVGIAVWTCFRLIRNEWVAAIGSSLLAPLIMGVGYVLMGDIASGDGADVKAIRSMIETLTPVYLAWLLTLVWIARKTGSARLSVIVSLVVRTVIAVALPWALWHSGHGTIQMPEGPEAALYGMVRHIGGAAVVTAFFWIFVLYCPSIIAASRRKEP